MDFAGLALLLAQHGFPRRTTLGPAKNKLKDAKEITGTF